MCESCEQAEQQTAKEADAKRLQDLAALREKLLAENQDAAEIGPVSLVYSSESQLSLPIEGKHVVLSRFHQHELRFSGAEAKTENQIGQFGCETCRRALVGPSWRCQGCEFDLCDDCVNTKERQQPKLGGKRVVLLYESIRNDTFAPDITTGPTRYAGVHAYEIREKLTEQFAKGKTRRITYIPLKEALSATQESRVIQFLREQHFFKTPYDTVAVLGLLPVLQTLRIHTPGDLSKIFSSELVVAALQHACVLRSDKPAEQYKPDDVCQLPVYENAKARVFEE